MTSMTGSYRGNAVIRADESSLVRPPDRCRGLAGQDQSQGSAPRSGDAPVGAPLTVIFARRQNARREEDGLTGFAWSRLCRVARCCGGCLPAGAGLLTWWRRRAQRAPARQGAAGRPSRSRRGAPLFAWLLALPRASARAISGALAASARSTRPVAA
jgi:hypothetical protein